MTATSDYTLEKPDLVRDAPFLNELSPAVDLSNWDDREAQKQRVTWVIRANDKTIGVAWINREETDYLPAPSLAVVMGAGENDSKGAIIKDMLRYAYGHLPYAAMYARYLVADNDAAQLFKKAGFDTDDRPYKDDDGQEWQNAKIVL